MLRICVRARALRGPPGVKRATLDLSACHDLLELTQDSEPRFIFELQFQATSYHIAPCVAHMSTRGYQHARPCSFRRLDPC